MRVIPVIDLMGGQVVRGIGGRREEYQPIVSRVAASCAPVDVARVFKDVFGFQEVYIADLDAIAGAAPAEASYAAIRALGMKLWVDAGVRDVAMARRIAACASIVIIGLESIAGPVELARICDQVGSSCLAFSLDLKAGRPHGNLVQWSSIDAWAIAQQAIAAGVSRLIVLDLTRVGVGSGTGTEELCRRLARTYPGAEIVAGGGVRSVADLEQLRQLGVSAALVASALHDGRIMPHDPGL